MLIHSASQLLTLAGGPQRGEDLGNLSIIPNGAILIQNERIIALGSTDEMLAAFPDEFAHRCWRQGRNARFCRSTHPRYLGW